MSFGRVPIREIIVSRVLPEAVRDLRGRVLRQGMPAEAAIFEGDDEPTTIHLGAFGENDLIGCATLFRRDWKGEPAWQLRGMAVEPDLQKSGVGAAILEELDRMVAASEFSQQAWCNARIIAKGFYEHHGWKVESELFEIPTAGPHHVMSKRL